jgi:hypothetical protein
VEQPSDIYYNPDLVCYDIKLIKPLKIAKASPGILMGEQSMIFRNDDTRNTRLLSGIITSDFCVVMALNSLVFDTLIKEKAKKEKEELASFIYDHIAGLS